MDETVSNEMSSTNFTDVREPREQYSREFFPQIGRSLKQPKNYSTHIELASIYILGGDIVEFDLHDSFATDLDQLRFICPS